MTRFEFAAAAERNTFQAWADAVDACECAWAATKTNCSTAAWSRVQKAQAAKADARRRWDAATAAFAAVADCAA